MKLCRYCALEMDAHVTVCPHCGRDRKTGATHGVPVQPDQPATASNAWRWWGALAILLLLAYFGYCAVMVQRVMH